jgi:tRNA(fMet)-specific endonuclease VapC
MALTVADTDALIDFLAGKGPTADAVSICLAQGVLATTVISRFELLVGSRGVRQEGRVRRFLAAIQTLPLDESAADRAAKVRRKLESEGRGIGMADSLIAGIVLVHGGTLLTRNRAHFARVEGLSLAR